MQLKLCTMCSTLVHDTSGHERRHNATILIDLCDRDNCHYKLPHTAKEKSDSIWEISQSFNIFFVYAKLTN